MPSFLKLLFNPSEWKLNRSTRKRKSKRSIGFNEENSTGVKLTNNTKHTRGLVGNIPPSRFNLNKFRLNRSKKVKPSNSSPTVVSRTELERTSTQQDTNRTPVTSFPKNMPMPNAKIEEQMAARRSFLYTPEQIKQMTSYNLVRLPKDHWRYAYNVIQGSSDSKKNEKLKAIEDRSSGVITNKQLNAENFPEDEE